MSEVWPRLTHQVSDELLLPVPILPPGTGDNVPLPNPMSRLRLTMKHHQTRAIATATAETMPPLLGLMSQLETLGYEFVRLEAV